MFGQLGSMPIKTVELEIDTVAKLEAAKWSSDESFSAVVRRAQFPGKPHVARELLADFKQRAGRSPLTTTRWIRRPEGPPPTPRARSAPLN